MTRGRRKPPEGDFIQYRGWDVNRDEVQAFLDPWQQFHRQPLLTQLSDPDDPTVSAGLYDSGSETYLPLRESDWIVFDDRSQLGYVLSDAEHTRLWEPLPPA